jgi:hypothetical protein
VILSDQRPPGEDWLIRRLADLERQVRELQAGRRLEPVTGAGGLAVEGGQLVVVAVYDAAGNVVVSADAVTGQGLATPWLPVPFTSHSTTTLPVDTTTSGTFIGLLSGRYLKQHARLWAQILCRASDGSTSGEVRIVKVSDSTQIGSTGTISLGYYGLVTIGPGDVPGGHLEEMELEVQARRTAGTGTIGVRMFGAYAQQS